MKKTSLLLTAFLIHCNFLFAAPKTFTNPGPIPAPKDKGRPTVALVLSGGGINGAAEIPILEEIDRLGIPVDMIFGTSIGAIVGGLYASGYTTEQIYDLFFSQNWPQIFADFSPSPYEKLYEDHGTKNNLLPVRTSLDGKLQIGKGITNGQKAYQMLKELTLKYPSDTDFDTLPIPFRAVATDMITGEPYLFSEGDLAEAIRASMNVAGLFEPLCIDGHYLLDGGLSYNMPVSLARKMGYDIVIAVEIGPSSNKTVRTYDSHPLYALQDSIYIPMKTVDKIEAQQADLVLYPDMSSFEITDFEKADEIYQEGKKAVLAASEEFIKIRNRIYPKGNEVKDKEDLYTSKSNLKPEKLVANNIFKEDEKYFQRLFSEYAEMDYSIEGFRYFINKIYQTGHYKQVQPRILMQENHYIMELNLTQKPEPSLMFLAGADLKQTASSESLSSYANANIALQYRGFATPDSLLSLRGTFLNDWKADFMYFQPFNRHCYLKAQSKYSHEIYGTYKQYVFWENTLGFGLNHYSLISLENGLFYNMSKTPVDFASKAKQIDWETGYYIRGTISTLDQPCFSHKGLQVDTNLKYIIPVKDSMGPESASMLAKTDVKAAIPMGQKFTLGLNGSVSYDFFDNLNKNSSLCTLEGNSNYNRLYFPQNAEKDTFSSTFLAGSVSLMYAPVDHLTIAGGRLYIIANGTWGTLGNMDQGLWSASAGIGLRIWDSCNMLLRFGTASTVTSDCVPFIAFDLGSLKF